MDRPFWESNCHLSGGDLARQHSDKWSNPGNARKAIRKAKRKYPDLEWRQDPRHKIMRPCANLSAYGLTGPPPGPAILLYDIETAPGLAWVWSAYDTNVISMERDWYMLSFAYKWFNGNGMNFVSIFQSDDFTPDTTNDLYVAERLAALFDRADVVVAHNGDKFDRRKANQRFLKHGIDPPAPYQSVDTLKATRGEFSHFANKLNELSRIHGFGEKEHHTGFHLWRECMRGDAEQWKVMEKYNRRDIALLEKLYVKILPWIGAPGKRGHPNIGFWHKGTMVCPKCGHGKLTEHGTHRTTVSEFKTYQCERCRGYCRARKRMSQEDDAAVQTI